MGVAPVYQAFTNMNHREIILAYKGFVKGLIFEYSQNLQTIVNFNF